MGRKLFSLIALSCFAAMLAGMANAGGVRPPDADEDDLNPNGKGWGERPDLKDKDDGKASKAKTKAGSGINYHGGPVMLGTTNVYYIWYGNWGSNTAKTILGDLAKTIGGSPYFNINTTYYDSKNVQVSNSVAFGGAYDWTDTLKYGTSLTDSEIKSIVTDTLTAKKLATDTNGVYFVLTSAEVTASSGFCTQYCGWHTSGTILNSDIKYAFVGNPDRCPSACSAQSTGPNGNAGADGMASIIAHELEEAVTDPDLNAWYDSKGAENADKCAWTFGTTYTANKALANVKFGSRDFLIQRNWVNSGNGSCAMSF